jgi:hypothetical protein
LKTASTNPGEKSVRFLLDPDMHRRFRISSSFENKSMTRMARELVERFVAESEWARATKGARRKGS